MTEPFFIDAHCHLSDARIVDLSEALVARARTLGVKQFLLGGTSPEDWARQKQIQNSLGSEIELCFGVHPWWAEKMNEAELNQALTQLKFELKSARALGETGLDFHSKRETEFFPKQESAFRAQLKIALEHSKPVVLHLVRSHARALEIIREEKATSLSFLLHSYSGSAEVAKQWLGLNTLFSLNGSVCREDQRPRIQKLLRLIPLSQLVFETDSPDQSWVTGAQTEPAWVVQIYEKAAELLQTDLKQLKHSVAENFARFR